MTPLASAEYWKIKFADWVHKMEQAQQYCIIYNADLTQKEMENICLVVYKYICFMSRLPDYTEYQLKESAMIVRKLEPPVYNRMKDIPWIAQKWADMQQYLLTGNIYLMEEAPLEAPSRREVSFEPASTQAEESQMEEVGDDKSEDGQPQ